MTDTTSTTGSTSTTSTPNSEAEAEADRLRAEVSLSYSRALSRSKQSGSSCCGTQAAGNAAQLVDYAEDRAALPGEELPDEALPDEALPDEARRSSFGCGNPLAFSDVLPGPPLFARSVDEWIDKHVNIQSQQTLFDVDFHAVGDPTFVPGIP